ncbi:MAG: 3'-5' exonuclease [Bacteroidota bacterium]|nr:3'-5' exonuclease [Bacteroidota bacterium]
MYQNEISKEEVAALELIQFEGPIHVVDTMEAFEQEIDQIARQPVLGFDTETRPSFKKGKVYPTSLIQIASQDQVWILRVNRIGYPARLLDLLSGEIPMKIGLGLQDDLRRLRIDFQFEPDGFLDLQNYVQAFRIDEKGLKKISGIVLNRRISKSQQVSNWDADVLSEAQLRYAATDAWICLMIYNSLRASIK